METTSAKKSVNKLGPVTSIEKKTKELFVSGFIGHPEALPVNGRLNQATKSDLLKAPVFDYG